MIKDENLVKIKATVESILPHSRIILFGSRSREDFESQSDYDVLVIIKQNATVKEKLQYESMILKQLAKIDIDADVLVKTENDIPIHLKRIDSVVKEAIETGVDI